MNKEFLKHLTSKNRDQLFPMIQMTFDAFSYICLYNQNQEIDYVNENFTNSIGYRYNELRINDFNCATNLVNRDEFNAIWNNLKDVGAWKGHVHYSKRGGESMWLDVFAFAFLDEKNNISQAVFIGSDITEYKKAIEIKQMFLANMSHELRTPLHGILGITNLMKDTLLTDEQVTFVKHLESAGMVLSKMVDDLIDLNKIETGKLKIEKHKFCPTEIIEQIPILFSERLKKKGLLLSTNISKKLPSKLIGDPFRLKQILMQLIENSLNFTNSGSILLEAELVYEGTNNYILQFKVGDTGIGIPREKLDFILEKFNQANMDYSKPIGGAGLGLTIAKNIIEAQGGRVSISSEEGKGTTVVFSLNFLKHYSSELNETLEKEERTEKPIKVLIAEDTELTQIVFRKQMQKLGYGYDFAANGQEAIEKLAAGKFDIILMDMHMPIMDGFEAIKHIRNNMPEPFKSIPIISVSANIVNETPTLCINAGANEYIPKPFKINDLKEKIDFLVNTKQ
jgi:two-component system, sensor histidine kinase